MISSFIKMPLKEKNCKKNERGHEFSIIESPKICSLHGFEGY